MLRESDRFRGRSIPRWVGAERPTKGKTGVPSREALRSFAPPRRLSARRSIRPGILSRPYCFQKMCPQDTMNLDGSARLTIRVTFAKNGPPLAALLLPLVQLVLGREVERDDFFAGV